MPETERNFVYIINPRARDGGNLRKFAQLIRRDAFFNSPPVVLQTQSVDAMARDLSAYPAEVTAVAVGGDGTVNMLAQAILQQNPARTLAVLPFGTGNAVAHQAGAGNVKQALDILCSGTTRPLDVMSTTHPEATLALISFSCGFESAFLHSYSLGRAGHRYIGALQGLRDSMFRCFRHIEVWVDGTKAVGAAESIYNAGFYAIQRYAFGLNMNPQANLQDGLGECRVYGKRRDYCKDIATTMLGGRAQFARSVHTWREAAISTTHPLQYDGESIAPGDVQLRMIPAALRLKCGRIEAE